MDVSSSAATATPSSSVRINLLCGNTGNGSGRNQSAADEGSDAHAVDGRQFAQAVEHEHVDPERRVFCRAEMLEVDFRS